MASDGNPVSLTVTSLVPSAPAAAAQPAGKSVPPRGNPPPSITALVAAAAAASASTSSASKPTSAIAGVSVAKSGRATDATPDVKALVAQLNKFLNDSGRPDQYRVDPNSSTMIQEVNPANGAVIDQFSASEFPALARSVGASGLLFNSLA